MQNDKTYIGKMYHKKTKQIGLFYHAIRKGFKYLHNNYTISELDVYNLETAIQRVNYIAISIDLFDDDDKLIMEVVREENNKNTNDSYPFIYVFGPIQLILNLLVIINNY